MSNAERVEALALKHLEDMFDASGKSAIRDSKERGSRLLAMISAGSKGKDINVCQMMGAVGQQNIDFRRVPLSFEGRVLPHFSRYDDGCEARGLVESSFVKGLTPKEFFMHAMAGREGLIDTAVKSVTGDTPVVFIEGGAPRYALIGDWIDGRLDANAASVAHFEERRMELLDLDDDVFIPTTDYAGRVTWGRVTAMTRHDPGEAMYRIRTSGGRTVTVTDSKSLLVWQADAGEFREVPTPEIVVGDFVPVTKQLPAPPVAADETVGWVQGRAAGRALADNASTAHVPDEYFAAPVAFVSGLINGFLAGRDRDATSNRRLSEGIAMLCSRLGIFCALTDTGLRIDSSAQARSNDVVLDAIVEIEVIAGFTDKVYDLTVPSTLNFGLANGLQVRDTSETGYLQRKLIKALEDCKVTYDRSVRVPNGAIVQFMYGEDGMDATSIETHDLAIMGQDLAAIAAEHLWTRADLPGMQALLCSDVLDALGSKDADAVFARLEAHFRAVVADKDALASAIRTPTVFHSIAFDRVLTAAARSTSRGNLLDLHPAAALDVIEELVGKLGVGSPQASPLLSAMVRAFLSPKRLLRRYGMGAAGLSAAKAAIERAFMSALCSPSEMVGILAAQSIAEPLTQMVLNTFHTTGIGSATKQLGGVPRIKELLSNTKNPKTPVMTVYLTRTDRKNALLLRDVIKTTTVADVIHSTALMYDADDTGLQKDSRLAALYEAFGVDTFDAASSPWLLRIVFDRRKMIEAGVHMHDVHRAVTETFCVSSVHSDDGAEDLVMRLRIPATSPDMMSELSACEDAVLATRVSGVPDIRMAHDFADGGKRYDAVARTWGARTDEWCLATQGANLIEVLGMDGVDSTRTTTNVIHQILDTLGIEAARAALLKEMVDNYGPDSYVNHRHLALLVDFMVHSGCITAIDRHGINHGDIGPLAKCSFEQPVDNLVRAAVFRESDKVEGVSASIMLGQVARCGTGDGDIVLDDEAYEEIDGDQAQPADLRNAADQDNEPALDWILSLPFGIDGAQPDLALDIAPATFFAE